MITKQTHNESRASDVKIQSQQGPLTNCFSIPKGALRKSVPFALSYCSALSSISTALNASMTRTWSSERTRSSTGPRARWAKMRERQCCKSPREGMVTGRAGRRDLADCIACCR